MLCYYIEEINTWSQAVESMTRPCVIENKLPVFNATCAQEVRVYSSGSPGYGPI